MSALIAGRSAAVARRGRSGSGVVSGGDGTEMLEFVEEPFDQITPAIEPFVEGRQVHPVRHKSDVGSGATRGKVLTQGVAVVGAVGQQNIATAECAEHILRATSVMGLAFGELEDDWQTAGVNERVDFRRQPTARTAHATGSRFFFCRWRHADER